MGSKELRIAQRILVWMAISGQSHQLCLFCVYEFLCINKPVLGLEMHF